MRQRGGGRSDQPHDVSGVLRGLLSCRELMIKVQAQVKVHGACFYGAAMVIASCDAFAAFLTGQRYYLAMMKPSGFMVPEKVDPEDVYDLPELPPMTKRNDPL